MSETIKPPKLADAVAEHLQAMILEGVLRPGEKLVAERELATKLGVSRPSLREALSLLERKGLLQTSKSGTVVAQIMARLADPLAELFSRNERVNADYFEFRRLMEVHATGLAALRATEADRGLIRDCLAKMKRAHEVSDPAHETETDVRLHVLIYEAAHNVVLLHVMRVLADMLRQGVFFNRETLYRRSGVRDKLLEQHVRIGEAVLDGDAANAEMAAAQHIAFIVATNDEIRRDELRQAAALRRLSRHDLVVE
jgi:GntR family transcriptional regulator, transcriptional repressor for pyruvate dehydrogenase complex